MKKVFAAVIAVLMMLTFFGCGKETKTYDADAVADALNAELEFGEMLEKSTADAAYSVYGINPALCSKAAIYMGSGATADEIAVFNCIDEAAFEAVYDAVEERLDYLHEGYSSYGPQEIPKIEAASIIKKGNAVIFCICENPENAEAVADSAAK